MTSDWQPFQSPHRQTSVLDPTALPSHCVLYDGEDSQKIDSEVTLVQPSNQLISIFVAGSVTTKGRVKGNIDGAWF